MAIYNIKRCYSKYWNNFRNSMLNYTAFARALSEYYNKAAADAREAVSGQVSTGKWITYVNPEGIVYYCTSENINALMNFDIDEIPIKVFHNDNDSMDSTATYDDVVAYFGQKCVDCTALSIIYDQMAEGSSFDATKVISLISMNVDVGMADSNIKNTIMSMDGLSNQDAFSFMSESSSVVEEEEEQGFFYLTEYDNTLVDCQKEAIRSIIEPVANLIKSAFEGVRWKELGGAIAKGFQYIAEFFLDAMGISDTLIDFTIDKKGNFNGLDVPIWAATKMTKEQFYNIFFKWSAGIDRELPTLNSFTTFPQTNPVGIVDIPYPPEFSIVEKEGRSVEVTNFYRDLIEKNPNKGCFDFPLHYNFLLRLLWDKDYIQILIFGGFFNVQYRDVTASTDTMHDFNEKTTANYAIQYSDKLGPNFELTKNSQIINTVCIGEQLRWLGTLPIWIGYQPTTRDREGVDSIIYSMFEPWPDEGEPNFKLTDYIEMNKSDWRINDFVSYLPVTDITDTEKTGSIVKSRFIAGVLTYAALMVSTNGNPDLQGWTLTRSVNAGADTIIYKTMDSMGTASLNREPVPVEHLEFYPYDKERPLTFRIHGQNDTERAAEYRSMYLRFIVVGVAAITAAKVMKFKKSYRSKSAILDAQIYDQSVLAAQGDLTATKKLKKLVKKRKKLNKLASLLGVDSVKNAVNSSGIDEEVILDPLTSILTGENMN